MTDSTRTGKAGEAFRRTVAMGSYVRSTSWRALLVGAILVLLFVWSTGHLPLARWEPALALATLISVWLIEKRRQWIDSLPKILTVHFWKWKGERWERDGVWEDAFLTGESDIRATAQQLGRQLLNTNEWLLLEGHYYVEDENPMPERSNGLYVRRFVVHVPYRGLTQPDDSDGDTTHRLYTKTDGLPVWMKPDTAKIRGFNDQVRGAR